MERITSRYSNYNINIRLGIRCRRDESDHRTATKRVENFSTWIPGKSVPDLFPYPTDRSLTGTKIFSAHYFISLTRRFTWTQTISWYPQTMHDMQWNVKIMTSSLENWRISIYRRIFSTDPQLSRRSKVVLYLITDSDAVVINWWMSKIFAGDKMNDLTWIKVGALRIELFGFRSGLQLIAVFGWFCTVRILGSLWKVRF